MYCVVEEIIVRMWLLYNPLLVDFKSNVVYRSFETVRKMKNVTKFERKIENCMGLIWFL